MDDPARAPATSSDPIDRAELAALAVITALGVLCRLAALRQPMRYDEASAWADFIGRDWWTILSRYPTPNNHVFFSLIAKLTSALAPYGPWAIRLPALLPGIAIVPATWAVGRRLADRATALLGAALAAGSMPLVLYSANARGHSLVVLGGAAVNGSDHARDRGSCSSAIGCACVRAGCRAGSPSSSSQRSDCGPRR